MEYISLKNVKKPVSRILYGTSNPAFDEGEDCNALLDEIFEMGVNAFDTARYYGEAERMLGDWMATRGNREKVVILSKGGHPALFIPRLNEKAIKKDFAQSLEALKTDYIDIYLLHRDNPKRPAGEFVEILNSLHAEGKIGAIGGSNWTHRRLEEANEYAYKRGLVPFTVSSPYFGLADMKGDPFGNGAVSIAGPKNEEARAWYIKTGMTMCSYSTLGRGFFSGRVRRPSDLKGWVRRGFATSENFERLHRVEKLAAEKNCSVAQIALTWALQHELHGLASVSALSSARMRENIAALEIKLTAEECKYLNLE